MTEVVCNECKIGKLQPRQLNFEEAIFLCNNEKDKCLWPLYPTIGQDISCFIVKRKISDIDLEVTLPVQKKKQKLDLEVTLPTKVTKSVKSENQPVVLQEDSLDKLLSEVNPFDQHLDRGDLFKDIDVLPPNDDTLLDLSFWNDESFGIAGPDAHETPVPTTVAGQPENAVASAMLYSESNLHPPALDDQVRTATALVHDQPSTRLPPTCPKKTKKTSKAKPVAIVAVNAESAVDKESNSFCDITKELEVVEDSFDERGAVDSCFYLLVHNRHILNFRGGPSTFIRKLLQFHANRIEDVKNSQNKRRSKIGVSWAVIKRMCSDILNKRKNSIWKKGQSLPACALSEILKSPASLNDLFQADVRSEVSCTLCGEKTVSIDTKTVHVMERVPEDFMITKACCFVQCSSCGADNQKKVMAYYMLPDIMAVRFNGGLPERSITSYDFVHQGNLYKVTEVIQHQKENDCFFTWTRNYSDNTWIRHNSFHHQPVSRGAATLDVPPSEFHLLIWEKCEPSKIHETNRPTQIGASHLRISNISQSMPNSPCLLSASTSLQSPLKSNLEGLTSREKSLAGFRTSGKPEVPTKSCNFLSSASGKTVAFGSLVGRHRLMTQSSDELDDLLPSPANSETSNASDGDVTIGNSSFHVPVRNDRVVRKVKMHEAYPWVAENIVAHQRKWMEWKSQSQQTPKKRVRSETGKQKRKTPEKPPAVVRKDPVRVQKLLAGIEIFLN